MVATLTPLPDPPSRNAQSNAEFVAKMDAWFVAWILLQTEMNNEIIPALNAGATAAFTGTSTSSVSVGTGSKSLTTQPSLAFIPGQTVIIAYDGSNYMRGTVTSYNSGTGALVVNVSNATGSGTYAAWSIALTLSAADLSAYLALSGGTLTGLLTLAAAASGQESLIIPHGSAPSSPTNGSVWSDTAGFWARVSGVTRQFAMTSGAQTFSGPKTLASAVLQNPQMDGTPIEDPFTISDGGSVTIDPANGNIQQWTLGANRTPTLTSITAGKWVELAIDDGSNFNVTWTSVTWMTDGGSAPTLKTSGFTHVLLRNRGGTLYGWRLGDGG